MAYNVQAIAEGRDRRRIYTFPLYVLHGDEITFLSPFARLAAHALQGRRFLAIDDDDVGNGDAVAAIGELVFASDGRGPRNIGAAFARPGRGCRACRTRGASWNGNLW